MLKVSAPVPDKETIARNQCFLRRFDSASVLRLYDDICYSPVVIIMHTTDTVYCKPLQRSSYVIGQSRCRMYLHKLSIPFATHV